MKSCFQKQLIYFKYIQRSKKGLGTVHSESYFLHYIMCQPSLTVVFSRWEIGLMEVNWQWDFSFWSATCWCIQLLRNDNLCNGAVSDVASVLDNIKRLLWSQYMAKQRNNYFCDFTLWCSNSLACIPGAVMDELLPCQVWSCLHKKLQDINVAFHRVIQELLSSLCLWTSFAINLVGFMQGVGCIGYCVFYLRAHDQVGPLQSFIEGG